jgi:hypothetical protein
MDGKLSMNVRSTDQIPIIAYAFESRASFGIASATE